MYQVAPVEGLLHDLLLSGRALVILDGLDELLDTGKRREVTKTVEIFASRYPLAPILVTSRRVGYDQSRLEPSIFSSFLVDGFEQDEVQTVRPQLVLLPEPEYSEHEAQVQADDFIEQSLAVVDLRSNPLMLALMCIIFRGEKYIPRNRPAVYEKCATLLFEKWDGHRGIEVPLQARDHLDAAMKFIAFKFIEADTGDNGLEQRALVEMLTEYLHERAMETSQNAEHAAREFVEYCSGRAWVFTDAGSTGQGEPIYTFTHRTFMEYFAAVHLTRITDTPEALANTLLPRVARQEWDVVAQLAVQKVDSSTDQGTARVLRAMLEEKRNRSVHNRGHVLEFIARCLAFAVVPPVLVRDVTSACIRHFLAHDDQPGMAAIFAEPISAVRTYATDGDAPIAAEQAESVLNTALLSSADRASARWLALQWLHSAELHERGGYLPRVAWDAMAIRLATHQLDVMRGLPARPILCHA